MEVGGAYAHRFHDLLAFLELRALIVTDIDSVKPNAQNKRKACPVADGEFTSNGCIKDWFARDISPADLLVKSQSEKIRGLTRLAYQIPEVDQGPSGRSFEDAFILANLDQFDIGQGDAALLAYEHAADQKKSEFALKYAIEDTNWTVPRYIAEGLRWLAVGASTVDAQMAAQAMASVAEAVAEVVASEGDSGHA